MSLLWSCSFYTSSISHSGAAVSPSSISHSGAAASASSISHSGAAASASSISNSGAATAALLQRYAAPAACGRRGGPVQAKVKQDASSYMEFTYNILTFLYVR